MTNKEIHVFICEDNEVAKKIMEFFQKGQVTYAAIFKENDREQIVNLLDEIQEHDCSKD